MDISEVLKDLCTKTGISGYEKNLSEYIEKMFQKYCDSTYIDKFYNVIGIKKGLSNNSKKIMITAHFDEIGLLVKSIEKNGFIRFTNMGGVDRKVLLATEVIIHGRHDIPGIIGAKPPHLLNSSEAGKIPKYDDLSIDTGYSYEYIKENVSIGDAITFKAEPFELLNNKMSAKCMDNRAGVAVLINCMEELMKVKHEMDIYFVATVQEEVGLRGAYMTSYNIEPDFALVVDACHGDIPEVSKYEAFPLGKGPAIGIGPNLHKKMTNKIIELSKNENIPYQIDVEAGDTGTEAWATQVSKLGIPTVLLSVPVRYMHTTVETISINDVRNTARLLSKFSALSQNEMEEILCY